MIKLFIRYLAILFIVFSLNLFLDRTSVYAASVGQQLASPETGWTRIDDMDENFEYSEGWSIIDNDIYRHKYTTHITSKGNQTIKFTFYGTKLRYISDDYNGAYYYTQDVRIKIDDLPEEYINQGTNWRGVYQCLLYEKKNLPLKFHNVTVTIPAKTGWNAAMLDAIDIDENCFLIRTDMLKLNIVPEEQNVEVNKVITEDLRIKNLDDIQSEDLEITYDKSKLQFIGIEKVSDVRVNKCKKEGNKIRICLSGKGREDRNLLAKLKFKTLASGNASIKITKAKTADNIKKVISSLSKFECGQTTIFINK